MENEFEYHTLIIICTADLQKDV